MKRPAGLTLVFVCGWWLAAVTPAFAQASLDPAEVDTVEADTVANGETTPASPAASALETALPGIKISGYAEASYAYATAAPTGGPIVGRSFDRFHDQFALNVFKLVLERPLSGEGFDAGFRVDVLVGQNATLLQSAGLNLGSQGDIQQAYAQFNIPVGHGLVVKTGKWVTLMGVEVIEDIVNPTWSEGNQFLFVENFTGVGLELGYKWSQYFDSQFRIYNGWDMVQDNNNAKSFMARVGIYPDDKTSLSFVGYTGPEQPGIDTAYRKGINLVAYRKASERLALWAQLDYGREDQNANLPVPTKDAEWYAAGIWATYDLSSKVGVGFRADWFDDRDGARTSGSPFTAPFPVNTDNELYSTTLTLNLKAWPALLLRPEVRYDHSSVLNAFGDDDEQLSLGMSAAYIY